MLWFQESDFNKDFVILKFQQPNIIQNVENIKFNLYFNTIIYIVYRKFTLCTL